MITEEEARNSDFCPGCGRTKQLGIPSELSNARIRSIKISALIEIDLEKLGNS